MNWQYHILAVGKTSVVGIAIHQPYYYYIMLQCYISEHKH